MRLLLALLLSLPAYAHAGEVVAVVGLEAITQTDLENRIKLEKINGTPAASQRQQALEALINEKVQLQHAANKKIKVSDAEVISAWAGLAERNNTTTAILEAKLKAGGVPKSTVDQRLRAQLAWGVLVSKEFSDKITVTDAEVEALVKNPPVVREILAPTPAQAQPRPVLARPNPATRYGLYQILFPLSGKSSKADVGAAVNRAQRVRGKISGCSGAASAARAEGLGATSGPLGTLRGGDLPAFHQQALSVLSAGQTSVPLPGRGGIVLLTVCSRTGQPITPSAPQAPAQAQPKIIEKKIELNAAQARRRLEMMKLDKAATKYLNDVRAQTIIEMK
jgi:peptidyl-prolyl cis-trans isomerase SurA